jgi:septin family protein
MDIDKDEYTKIIKLLWFIFFIFFHHLINFTSNVVFDKYKN